MSAENEIISVGRSADTIATEIRVIVRRTHQMMCAAAIEIGQRLKEAQKLVPHGEWGSYVERSCGFSQRTAQSYMQLAADPANAQTFADLPYSKALPLLSLPEGTVEEFRAEHPVEDLSVRELKAQIKEFRRQLEKAADAGNAQQQLLLVATEENGALKQRLDGIDADYKAQLDAADRENESLRAKLAEAERREPALSPEDVARIRKEGADAQAQLDQERIESAEHRTDRVAAEKNEEIAQLRAKLQDAQKSAPSASANPNYGAFKASFEALVPAFQQVCRYAVAAANTPEQVTQNRNAIKGLLLKLGQMADREVSVV